MVEESTGDADRARASESDEALAMQAAAGESQALEALLVRNLDRVHVICRRLTCHPDDATEATQEALLVICRNITSYEGPSSFTIWLYRIATQAALVQLHRHNRSTATLSAGQPDAGAALDIALVQIPPELRAAVVLRDLCDLDYLAIGQILDLPRDVVRSRVLSGQQLLAALLATP